MTRMFTGSRGGSGEGGGTNPIFDKYEKRSAKKTFMNKMRGIDDSNLTPEERYKKVFDKKVEELRAQALSGGSRYSFSMPGTEPQEKKISKGMEEFIRRIAAKKAKEEENKLRERNQVKIQPKVYMGLHGGRIDKKGRVYGPDNRWIASVNMKTGRVTSKSGMSICKYNPQSPYTDHQIVQFIAKEYNPNKPSFFGGSAGHGAAGGGMGNFYGGGGNKGGGMGSFYGNDDNKGGGFWG